MRELERRPPAPSAQALAPTRRVVIVGAGRLGTALAAALAGAGIVVDGPLVRDASWPAAPGTGAGPDAVLLCVPDAEIAPAARRVPPGPPIGHCSGATGLEVLGDREGFSLHPLMTVTADSPAAVLAGATAAIDATSAATLALVSELAAAIGMPTVRVSGADRAAYHAAASIAANFLVTVESAAEAIGATAGLERAQLVPLVRAAVENWAALGPRRALTGPVARGDESTVARQRAALAQRTPELVALFDALADATRRLAAREAVPC